MSDVHAYRASDELAAALRQHKVDARAFDERIKRHEEENPGRRLLADRGGFSSDPHFLGFEDSTNEVPDGLSRASKRNYLRPKKNTKVGRAWQAILDDLNTNRPRMGKVFHRFGVPENAFGDYQRNGSQRIAATQFLDGGPDGVVVVNKFDLDGDTFSHGNKGHGEQGERLPPAVGAVAARRWGGARMSYRYTADPRQKVLDDLDEAREDHEHYRTLAWWSAAALMAGAVSLLSAILLGAFSVGTGVDMGFPVGFIAIGAALLLVPSGCVFCHVVFEMRRTAKGDLRRANRAWRDHLAGEARAAES